ncbi:glucan endo-1,3-beta-D-glucosidase [Winogradskyella sp.]|uniref:glucan endo-1,3-beta-D-glucosidase n=1 Tax=Winogradskyella sp. TaxID=1883156 RepID=UPI0025CDFEDD|nr:glucan endo-1,3-beta-D-glucosidase [Winogradskyella sp.]
MALLIAITFNSCQDEDQEFGDLITPTNIQVEVTYLDDIDNDGMLDVTEAPGLGSGQVRFMVSADNAINYQVVVQGENKLQGPNGVDHIFSILGENTFSVTAIATGTGGVSSSITFNIDVLSLYEPPADLLEMLRGDGSRVWRIKSEANGHFGLGPAGGDPFSFFASPAEGKAGVGMYDDRYVFNEDGTFTHIVDNTNDDPTTDVSGTVFGREVLINELGGVGGGEQDGADIINYVYEDYSQQWSLTAPGGVETLNLSGIGFLGYYIGGNHQYQILSRSANEMTVKSTDGNGDFDWGFILIAE